MTREVRDLAIGGSSVLTTVRVEVRPGTEHNSGLESQNIEH